MKNKGAETPIRTCVACGEKKPKSELVRFVFKDGISMDNRQTEHGRGAYVCKNDTCRANALKKKKLEKALQKESKRCDRKTG